jgi:hypothetical protein
MSDSLARRIICSVCCVYTVIYSFAAVENMLHFMLVFDVDMPITCFVINSCMGRKPHMCLCMRARACTHTHTHTKQFEENIKYDVIFFHMFPWINTDLSVPPVF